MREKWIHEELNEARKAGLERHLRPLESLGAEVVLRGELYQNFASNDYLSLASDERVVAGARAALERYGAGATSSRLVGGTTALHEALEGELADFMGAESCLVFGSGSLANIGLLSAVAGRDDLILADRLVHATLIDGALLSRAKLLRFRHNDLGHLEDQLCCHVSDRRRAFVVTESVFSMDGDIAPLREMARLCDRFGAQLVVDEAHALGVFGPQGRGLVPEADLGEIVFARTATLSKSLGSYGGVVAGSRALRELLINRSRSFIYSTGLPPSSAGAALSALSVILAHPAWGEELLSAAREFAEQIGGPGLSQIVPVILGPNERALEVSQRLVEERILAVAIRPPTVPPGSARIRFSIVRGHRNLREVARQVRRVIGQHFSI